jgi:hypothetical protein
MLGAVRLRLEERWPGMGIAYQERDQSSVDAGTRNDHGRLLDLGMKRECIFDLAQFDTVTMHFHHVITPAEIVVVSVWIEAHQISSRVGPTCLWWMSPVAKHHRRPIHV